MAIAIKFASLLIKTLTKPMANSIKRKAQQEQGLLRHMCHEYGQFHNRVETSISLRLLGHHAKRVKPLPPEDAVALGAAVLSEAFVLSVAGGLLYWEVSRKAAQDEEAALAKAKALADEKKLTEDRFQHLEHKCELLWQSTCSCDSTDASCVPVPVPVPVANSIRALQHEVMELKRLVTR